MPCLQEIYFPPYLRSYVPHEGLVQEPDAVRANQFRQGPEIEVSHINNNI